MRQPAIGHRGKKIVPDTPHPVRLEPQRKVNINTSSPLSISPSSKDNFQYYATLSDQLIAKYQKLVSVEETRLKETGMSYYIPNAVQHKAHQSKSRTILLCGANRIGKSTFGVMELCWHLTKNYPEWFPKERRFKGPIKAAISVDSFDKVSNVIEPKIKSFLPSDYYKIKRKTGYLSRIECRDGSFVAILTLEMDDSAYESADWDFVWEDEPQDQRKREGLIRGLVDRKGLEVITFTPLTEAWMKTELIDKADGKRIECFFAQMRDNKFDISGNPILSEDAIKEFEESLPDEIKEIRVDGQFFTLRGRVYKEFSDTHIVTCQCEGKSDLCESHYKYPDPVICVLDPHDRKPHHVIWAYITRNDDIYIDYELSVRCELDDLARKIKSIEKARNYKMRKRIIDPNFGLKPAKPGANWSVKEELTKHGTSFYPANDEVELRHMMVRDALHFNKTKELSATNAPKIFFNKENCPVTIRSMRNYQYDEWLGKTKNKRDPKEETMDKDSDGADTVGYLIVSKPRFRFINEYNFELEEALY